jgi:hypothetical protein
MGDCEPERCLFAQPVNWPTTVLAVEDGCGWPKKLFPKKHEE